MSTACWEIRSNEFPLKELVNDDKHNLSAVQTLIQEMNPVDPQSDPVQFLADFQLSINDILTWLRERLPEIQYRYHSPNAPLPSQKFKGVPQASSAPLDDYLNAFRELFTLP